MSTMEAPVLPDANADMRRRGAGREDPGAAKRIAGPMPGVLLLRSSSLSHSAVRVAAREAGMPVALEVADDRSGFVEALRSGLAEVIVAGLEGLPGVGLRELFERASAAQPPVPVILVGRRIEESEALRLMKEGAVEYVEAAESDRLPSAIERALRGRRQAAAQAITQHELDRAAGTLRENQKLITVGRLAASIAHEINNPLESITNLLYLLGEERGLSEAGRGYLTLARRELDRVGQISRQTLNFARETAGPQRARLDELMEEVLSLYSRRIAEKNLQIERRYDCHEEAMVYPGEMRQVLSNLVTNAVEASSMGGRLCLRVRRSRSWADPGVVGIRVAVGDTGTGISPEVQRRLGEPFFTTKGQRGTGLGLWVTRSIIERYGGELQLKSSSAAEHHGTVFSIFLPTNLGPRAVERRRDPEDAGSEGSARPRVVPMESGPSRQRVSETPVKRRVNGE